MFGFHCSCTGFSLYKRLMSTNCWIGWILLSWIIDDDETRLNQGIVSRIITVDV